MIRHSDPATMFTLLALVTGNRLGVTADRDALTVQVPGVPEAVALTALDESLAVLEARRWVRIDESGPVATDLGRYQLKQWLLKQGVNLDRFDGLRLVAVDTRRAG